MATETPHPHVSFDTGGGSTGIALQPIVADGLAGEAVRALTKGFLADATYQQVNADLVVTGPDGVQLIVQDYFNAATPPDLVSPDGNQVFSPQLVESFTLSMAPGQYAQAGTVAKAQPIGTVAEVKGTVFAIRADGTKVQLNQGDPVYQGDVIESGDDGAIKMLFVDKTTFALGDDARLSLDELVYNPATQEGQSQFSILKGVFVFASGQIAKTDNTQMTVLTPVATIGIRGTEVSGKVSESGAQITVISGTVTVSTNGGTTTLGAYGATTTVTNINDAPSTPFTLNSTEMTQLYSSVTSVSSGTGLGGGTGDGGGGAESESGGAGEGGGADGSGGGTTGEGSETAGSESEGGGGDGGDGGEDDGTVEGQQAGDGETGTGTGTSTGTNGSAGNGVLSTTGDPLSNGGNDALTQTAGTGNGESGGGDEGTTDDGSSSSGESGGESGGETGRETGGEADPVVGEDDPIDVGGQITITGSAGNDGVIGSDAGEIFNMGAGNDTAFGQGGNDTIIGGSGDDSIDGGEGSDSIDGGDGDDLIKVANTGNDSIDGGADNDTLDFTGVGAAISFDLQPVGSVSTATVAGNTHSITNVETIIGDSSNDTFNIQAETDISIDGAGGIDTIDGSNLDGVTIVANLQTGTLTYDSPQAQAPTIQLFSNIENITGGDGDDTLEGDDNVNVIIGGNGDDTILGNGGGDTLQGGQGADSLNGGTGNDTLFGNTGDDLIDGGGGTDTVNYSLSISGVTVDLSNTSAQDIGGGEMETIIDVENVIGNQTQADTITGDGNDNVLDGSGGADTLIASAGNDTLEGGTGSDLADYSAATVAVTANLATGTVSSAQFGTDILSNIETITTGSNADTITGSANEDVVNGSGGDDTVIASAGDDLLDGGAGADLVDYASATVAVTANLATGAISSTQFGTDSASNFENITTGSGADTLTGSSRANSINAGGGDDTVIGSAGNDSLVGGTGSDLLDYSAATVAVTANLSTGSASSTQFGTDAFGGFEQIITGSGADVLTGSGGNDTISSGNGNDTIDGGDAGDTINGGDGADIILGGNNDDKIIHDTSDEFAGGTVDGGSGTDLLSLDEDNKTLDLGNATVQSVFSNFENFELDGDNQEIQVDAADVTGSGIIDGTITTITAGTGTGGKVTSNDAWSLDSSASGFSTLSNGSATLVLDDTLDRTGITITAGTVTWDNGGGDTSWFTADNWNPDVTPADTATAILTDTGAAAILYDQNTATTLTSISGDEGLNISTGTLLVSTDSTLAGAVSVTGGTIGAVSGGTLQFDGGISGGTGVIGTTGGVVNFNSNFAVNDGSNLTIAGDKLLSNGSINIGDGASLNVTATEVFFVGGANIGSSVEVQSTINLSAVSTLTFGDSASDTITFDNNGPSGVGPIVELATGATLAGSGTILNKSDISLDDGETVAANLENQGTLSASGTSGVTISSPTLTNSGNIDIDANVNFSSGIISNTGTIDVGAGSTLTLATAATIDNQSGASFDIFNQSGVLEGSGLFIERGTRTMLNKDFDFDNIDLQNEGKIMLKIDSFSNNTLTVNSLTNNGTLNFTENATGQELAFDGSLSNTGVMNVSGDQVTLNVASALQNTGTIDLASGTTLDVNMSVNEIFTQNGSIDVNSSSRILVDGLSSGSHGTFVVGSSAAFSGTGTIELLEADFNVDTGATFTFGGTTPTFVFNNTGFTDRQFGGAGTFVNEGSLNLSGDTLSGTFINNETIGAANDGTISIDTSSALTVNGSLLMDGESVLSLGAASTLTGTGNVTANNDINFAGDAVNGGLNFTLGATGTLSADSSTTFTVSGAGTTFSNSGAFNASGATIAINDGATFVNSSSISVPNFTFSVSGGHLGLGTNAYIGNGSNLIFAASAGTSEFTGVLNPLGSSTITVGDETTFNLKGSTGESDGIININAATTMVIADGAGGQHINDSGTFNVNATFLIDVNGGTFKNGQQMNLNDNTTIELGGGTFENQGPSGEIGIIDLADTKTLLVTSDTAGGQFINNGTLTDTSSLGVLDTTDTDVTFTQNGVLDIGSSPGHLQVNGSIYNGDSAYYEMELAGTTAVTEHDKMTVTDTFGLGGSMHVVEYGGFTVSSGESFTLFDAGTLTGSFDHVTGLNVGHGVILDLEQTATQINVLGKAVTHQGTTNDDILTGTAGADVMTGGSGNDTMVGNGGSDVLFGDEGNDLFQIDGINFSRLDGGSGTDTLALTGTGQSFNLTGLRGDQIQDIEMIDLSAVTGATLTLSADLILSMTQGTNALTGAEDMLVIAGGSTNSVEAGEDWTNTGSTTVDGESYSVYQNTNGAQVAVDQQVGFA
jgi:Ca2+-binding RTX toxin-like protein